MTAGSLRWRLVRNLVMLQVTASVLVLVGFIAWFWALGRFVDEGGEKTAETVGAALRHAPGGQLMLGDAEEIRWLLKSSPGLWFIARDARGQELRYGDVPPRYEEMVRVLDGLARVSLDLADSNARPAARFERIETAEGPVNLVVKTGAPFSWKNKLKWWTVAFLILVAPTMLVTCLVVVVATPFVIRRGLRGVVATAAQAENVNIDALATRLPVHGVPAEILDAPQSVLIRVDAAAIERAVGNLIQNAIEHGGRHGEIQVLVLPPGTIVVNDSGPGIPLEERERVVEPFHRIHPRGRGAGLGLHLVSEVAQMHGGTLIVDESPSGGASVRLVLVSGSSTADLE